MLKLDEFLWGVRMACVHRLVSDLNSVPGITIRVARCSDGDTCPQSEQMKALNDFIVEEGKYRSEISDRIRCIQELQVPIIGQMRVLNIRTN